MVPQWLVIDVAQHTTLLRFRLPYQFKMIRQGIVVAVVGGSPEVPERRRDPWDTNHEKGGKPKSAEHVLPLADPAVIWHGKKQQRTTLIEIIQLIDYRNPSTDRNHSDHYADRYPIPTARHPLPKQQTAKQKRCCTVKEKQQ